MANIVSRMKPKHDSKVLELPLSVGGDIAKKSWWDFKRCLFAVLAGGLTILFVLTLFSENMRIWAKFIIAIILFYAIQRIVRKNIIRENQLYHEFTANKYIEIEKILNLGRVVQIGDLHYIEQPNGGISALIRLEYDSALDKTEDAKYEHYEYIAEAIRNCKADSFYKFDVMYWGRSENLEPMNKLAKGSLIQNIRLLLNNVVKFFNESLVSYNESDYYMLNYSIPLDECLTDIDLFITQLRRANFKAVYTCDSEEFTNVVIKSLGLEFIDRRKAYRVERKYLKVIEEE